MAARSAHFPPLSHAPHHRRPPQVTTTHHPFRIIANVSAPYVQPSYNTLPECGSCVNVSTGGVDTNLGIVTFAVPTGPLSSSVGYTCTVHPVMVNKFVFFEPTPSSSPTPSQSPSQAPTPSPSPSQAATPSPTPSRITSQVATPSPTPSRSPSQAVTPSPTQSQSSSQAVTPSRTPSPVSLSPTASASESPSMSSSSSGD